MGSRLFRHSFDRRALLNAGFLGALSAFAAACTRSTGQHEAAASAPAAPASPTETALPSRTTTQHHSASPRATQGVSVPARGRPANEVAHGDRSRPLVALTFHGAGDPTLAMSLLSEIERAGVHISVLAVGTWVTAQPQIARHIVRAGHDLGNHTMHHLPMLDLTATSTRSEISECAKALRAATGSQGRWFRASATQHTNATIRKAAGEAGYPTCVSYDVDGLDWQDPPKATVERAVLTGAQPGSIISLHLGHRVTIAALPAVLSGLRAKGLQPVTLTQLLG